MTGADENWHIDKDVFVDIVRELATTECGPVAGVDILHTWGPTVVMAVLLTDGAQVVFKASGRQDVHAEAAACRTACAAGVAAPRVLALGEHEGLPGRRWYLMSRLSGTPWMDLLPDPDRDAMVLDQLAECFACLHTVAGKRFGPMVDESGGEFATWADWLRQGFATDIDQLIAVGAADAGLTDLSEAAISGVASELGTRPGALIHGDLGDGEVFVDPATARVTGIADWGAAIIADPFYDFARFVAGGPVDDPGVPRLLPGLRTRYAARTGIDWADHRRLIDLYDAHNAINNAAWAVREGVEWVASLRAKAERLLRSVR